jgi:hypothetical protein
LHGERTRDDLKAASGLDRWAGGMLALTTAAIAALLCSDAAVVEDDAAERARKNTVTFRSIAAIPYFGFDLGYERALGRRFSVGGRFATFVPRSGYAHLQGFEEALFARVWVPGTLRGVYAEASLGVAHQLLVRSPRLSETALIPGLALGWRWRLRNGVTLGASAGLGWGVVVAQEPLICTPSTPCPAVRRGVHARLALEVGYAF